MVLMRSRFTLVAALICSTAALVAPAVAVSSATHAQTKLSTLESGVLHDLNAIRVHHGLRPLRPSAALAAAAVAHTREMAADGYFAHTSHDGTAFWKRIGHWYPQSGHHYWAVGENLLWSSPDTTPAAALDEWMRSPEHRANILTASWREIGVAAVHVGAAPGTYRGRAVTIVTTDFGVRR